MQVQNKNVDSVSPMTLTILENNLVNESVKIKCKLNYRERNRCIFSKLISTRIYLSGTKTRLHLRTSKENMLMRYSTNMFFKDNVL